MAHLCVAWEGAAKQAEALGVRVAVIRIGVVLDKEGGALRQMLTPFKMFAGGPVGGGKQWMSWIHNDDLVGLIVFALENAQASGPINGTAPHPVRNAEFSKSLSSVLWKPYAPWRLFIPIGPPDAVLKLMLGEVAGVITAGQKVLPRRAEELGYRFKFPDLEGALRDVFAELLRGLLA